MFVGDGGGGAGAVYQSGGTLTLTQTAGVDNLRIGSTTNGKGYYKLSGGTLTANEIGVGASLGNTVGVMDVTGGTATSNGWIVIGRGSGTSSGVLNVTGGLVEFSKTLGAANAGSSKLALNWAGSSGALSVLNVQNASVVGDDHIIVSQSNTAGTMGVINLLSGGLLQGAGVFSDNPGGTALLNFNGGTLKAHTTNMGVNFMTSGNIDAVTIYSGGATIDSNGTAITISRPLEAPTGNGVTTIAVANGGSGYIGAPMLFVTGGTGTGATAVANMVDDGTGNGTFKIGSITVTNPGRYTVDPTTVTSSGGAPTTAASGFSINTAANVGGGLTKSGAGTLTLSGLNTYTGPTTVSAGTLTLSHGSTNNIASSSKITLAPLTTLNVTGLSGGGIVLNSATGQTLEGTGTIIGNLTVGNNTTIAPGASPGTMFQTGTQTWLNGGSFDFEIDNANAAAGGDPGWSLMDITGGLVLTGLGPGGFTIDIDSLVHPSHAAAQLQVLPFTDYVWDFVHTTTGITGFNANLFTLDTTGFSTNTGGSFTIRQTGNNLELVFTSIPEPSTWRMALVGLLALGLFAWRQHRHRLRA
jgi:autotransporter-associated beta strand protein